MTHKFQPGKSGNPNGRPKGTGGKRSRLRKLQKDLDLITPKALKKIEELIDNKDATPQTQFSAAKYVVDLNVAIRDKIIADEKALNDLNNPTQADDEDDEPQMAGFSLTVVKD